MTNDLSYLLAEDRMGAGSKFTAKYNRRRLVWAEPHARMDEAIVREKQIKKWNRAWKVRMIEAANSDWRDLADVFGGVAAP